MGRKSNQFGIDDRNYLSQTKSCVKGIAVSRSNNLPQVWVWCKWAT
jgi:hypothetical protein